MDKSAKTHQQNLDSGGVREPAAVSRSPAEGSVASVLRLQRTIGNRAVQTLFQETQDHEYAKPISDHRIVSPRPHREFKIMFSGPPPPQAVFERKAGAGAGSQLPTDLRQVWQERLSRDLSTFRIHTDSQSARAVRAVGANGVSLGHNAFFASGRYDPSSETGRHLLAHEVTHGLQTRRLSRIDQQNRDIPERSVALESEANRIGQKITSLDSEPLSITEGTSEPVLMGDKKIKFGGKSKITVSDTYVLHGSGATPAFLAKFRKALDKVYNSPSFTYRGYDVKFSLSARLARYKMHYSHKDGFSHRVMADSPFDSGTKLLNVAKGSGSAWGIFEVTVYENSSEGTLAHEVGHYLTERAGYFSEGYTESLTSRLGITKRKVTVKPEAAGDIMGTTRGTVREFSLSGILDEAIDEFEARSTAKTP